MSGRERIAPKPQPLPDGWARIKPRYDRGLGSELTIGVIALATDRAGVWDLEQYVAPYSGVDVFSTRIPMATVATPQTLKALGRHVGAAAKLLLPGSKVDVIGFSCTSGTVAIGPAAVHAAIRAVRPDAVVCTPMEAGAKALRKLGCTRISLLTPYRPKTGDLVAGYFRQQGFEVLSQATFDLDGDPDMNRVSGPALLSAARAHVHPDAEGLFISCTGLRTSGIVGDIEETLGLPVVTSNQALAWDCVRSGGITRRISGRGRLFRV